MLDPHTAAAPRVCRVAKDQVGVDHQALAGTITGGDRVRLRQAVLVGRDAAGRRIGVRRTHHQQAAAIGRDGRIGGLIKDDGVVFDVAVLAEADVRDTTTVAGAEVAAHPVVGEVVVVGARIDADTTRAGWRRGEDLIAERRIVDHCVVVDVDGHVEAERQAQVFHVAGLAGGRVLQRGAASELDISVFASADRHAARHRALVVAHAIVRDLQVVRVGMYEDAAAALRAVADAQAIDARWIAIEVRRIRGLGGGTRDHGFAIRTRQGHRAIGERRRRERGLAKGIQDLGSSRELHTLAEDRDGGAFIGTHQAGLDQLFRQVAIQAGIPAEGRFQRQAVDHQVREVDPPSARLGIGREIQTAHAGSVCTRVRTAPGQAEQADDLFAPGVEQRAGRMRVGIDHR